MPDPRDILELGGRRAAPRAEEPRTGPAQKFLCVWYRCCHTYGRLYRNATETRYEGACPRCGARVFARIGPDGTKRRLFEAR